MKYGWMIGLALAGVMNGWGAPLRVAVLDFEDQTGAKPDALLGGAIAPGALAEKGVFLLTRELLGSGDFNLIDRRDFFAQMDQLRLRDGSEAEPGSQLPAPLKRQDRNTPVRPTFIQAAQLLRTDVVLRGNLMSFSSGKKVVNQGNYKTEFAILSVRVGLEALDPTDGAVIAAVDGVASENVRQTQATYTELSEEDAVGLLEKAIAVAVPNLEKVLAKRQSDLAARPKVKLSVKTSADPALVEVDGVLVGSTPLENIEVYRGDHVLAVGKPGYRDVTKRILLEKNTAIEIPMLRIELSPEEMQGILEKIRLNIIPSDPDILIQTVD